MMRVAPQPEPADFDAKVRQPGRNALLELIGSPDAAPRPGRPRRVVAATVDAIPANKLPDLWAGDCLQQLADAYGGICAYLGMIIPVTGMRTADHFVPKEHAKELAYEWSNFRLASLDVNRAKGTHRDVLDPFEIEDGWFVLNPLDFRIAPASTLDPARQAAVQATVDRLELNDPVYRAARAQAHDDYFGLTEGFNQGERVPWAVLLRDNPYVASEVERQGLR